MYSELTLTSPSDAQVLVKRFWLVSENIYERNKLVANLIKKERARTGEYPLFEVHAVA